MGSPFGYTGNEEQGNNNDGNPAWQEFLDIVPQDLHDKITPVLQKWDQGVQGMVSKVHSEYEPWKGVISSGVDPQRVSYAINLANSLEEDPVRVYQAIGDYYKDLINPTSSSTGSNSGQGHVEPETDPYDSRFATLEQQNKVLAEYLVAQRNREAEEQAYQALDKELADLKKTYGEYDEPFVLSRMQAGRSAEDAVKEYFQWYESKVGKLTPKPLLLGGNSGSLPSNTIDPKKLDDKGTRNLIVEMLEATKRSNQ